MQKGSCKGARGCARRYLASLTLFALVFGVLALGACVSVDHLGERTGRAYHQAFAKQTQAGDVEHKELEAELALVGARKIVAESGKPSRPSRPVSMVQLGGQ